MKLTLIVEPSQNGTLWGRVWGLSNYIVTGKGETMEALLNNVKQVMRNYKQKAGELDSDWCTLDVDSIEFDVKRKQL